MLMVVLRREGVPDRDCDFMAAGMTSVNAGPWSRIARLDKLVKRFVLTLPDENVVFI
jgi:hypothetical protein